ncbi:MULTISPECIES: enoyl-CoA hydratase/isomerase family protein [unclassified Roseovarius]|uniref:enoyl-CoA hydratase/isomerase family protein n=1 Tax=unclassified Roseovarius TaxID=2614913 RepID=UPI00273FC03C|nr:enoyl-CoA hydratase/isomerase family protein [Roseovarius sp. MMSF_3350]
MSEVIYELTDGVAVLRLARGEANALSPGMRRDLAAALERAAEDDTARAVVLTGAGGTFCSGVDLSEFDGELAEPWIGALTRSIETHPKPVVAALEGAALGAGFELALAAHARVAHKTCRVALPEVSLGLMPSGGSTQRLPRLLGAQAALEILLSGRPLDASEPRLAKLFAAVTEEPPLATALATARRFAQAPDFPRTSQIDRGFSDPAAYRGAVAEVAARLRSADTAEGDILRCVEAAQLLPYEQGLRFEEAAFEACLVRPEARASRHLYAAERRALAWPEAQEGRAREIGTVVLTGSDPVLAELAVYCLDRGQRVAVLSPGPAGAALAARARAVYEGAVARKRMTPDERDSRLARLSHGSDPVVLMAADLVLDGGGGDPGAAAVRKGTVWCLVSGRDGASARRAQLGEAVEVLALRAYRPAHVLSLVELAVPEGAAPDAVMTVMRYFAGSGRVVLRSADRPGMIGHRLMGAVQRAALALMRAGAGAQAVEDAARRLGFARGPLELIETDGIGVTVARLRRVFGSVPELALLDARADAVAAGKTPGQGFYASHGQALAPDPGLAGWMDAWREGQRDLPEVPDVTLERALHAALVAEAGRMLGEGTVARASDMDLCMVRGYGFDPARGGPLLWADFGADRGGLLGLVRAMKVLAPLGQDLWTPPALLEEMVKFGRRFFGGAVS